MTITLAALLFLAGPRLDLSVGAGGDSNPFEMPDDRTAAGASTRPEPGMFIPIEASATWKTRPRQPVRFGVEAWLDGIFFTFVAHDTAAAQRTNPSHANRWTAEISAPVVFDPMHDRRRAPWRLDVTLEPFFGMHRETYTSHRTGLPIRIDEDPAPSVDVYVDLRDRYSYNDYGLALAGDLDIGRNVDVNAGARLTSVDYIDDYGRSDAVDSWDYTEYRGDTDVSARRGDGYLAAGYTLRLRDYAERFPRDENGDKVVRGDPGYEPQTFTFHDVSIKGGLVKSRGRAVIRFRTTRKLDGYRGYSDYSENAVTGDFRIVLGTDSELRFSPGYAVRSYDDLRVNYDPAEPVSSRRRLTMKASCEWPALSRWTRMFAGVGLVSQTSTNPLYTYTSYSLTTGVRATWK